jgi:hypothetical protein
MLIKANVLALASYILSARNSKIKGEGISLLTLAISRYRDKGYDTPRVNTMITARLLVRRPRTGTDCSDGNNALMTCGMLSPMIMQKAIMPPKALLYPVSTIWGYGVKVRESPYKAH